jgi:aminoglycoside phosphotransferase family enzyme/predicted kinase
VLRFLENGGLGEPVERIDTHGAHILFGRERAWKMKRAVRFSFMDLSTLARREAAIRAELELNRRTAPQLYEAVMPVTRADDGALALDGPGLPVEWLLRMRRFPAGDQLDEVAGRGDLMPVIVDRLAEVIADFHAAADMAPERGGSHAMRAVISGNADDLRSLVPADFDECEVAALNNATAAELERVTTLLEERRAEGRVRRCHGDLHLRNIVLLDGQPVLFDCLEFSEELASIDVLYDLAFLVMDLLDRGLRSEACRLLQAYGDRSPDDRGLALLPLFLAVRATVRAKVEGFSGNREPARAYLALARAALSPAASPRLIAVAGRSGTGKSTLAAVLAPHLDPMPGAVLLRSDVIRKRLLGRGPTERLPPEAYSAAMSARVYGCMLERATALLRAGRAVICDAVYAREQERAALAALACACGVPFDGIWLEAPDDVLEARVGARKGDASDADIEVVHHQSSLIEIPNATWLRLRADRRLPDLADDAAARLRLGR